MFQFEQSKWIKILDTIERFLNLPAKDRKAYVQKAYEDGTAKLLTNNSKKVLDRVDPLDCKEWN